MSFQTMIAEVHGAVPKISIDYAKTLINRAWRDVRRASLWSFQVFDTNWVTANVTGNAANSMPLSCNVTQGNNQVVFNANATAAINNIGLGPYPPPVTQQQFRVGISTIYSIWNWDSNNGIATLDRPYTDASNNNTSFSIGSWYMTVPYSDFVRFLAVVDMIDFQCLNLNRTREMITRIDPQLTMFFWPTDVVPYERDLNANSNTYGYWRYMLWGLPQAMRTYQLLGIREGADLSAPSDTLPFVIGEDVVLARAKFYAYEYAESIKGESPRDQGPDWRFLAGAVQKNYEMLLRDYRRRDREQVDNFFTVRRAAGFPFTAPYYTSIGATAWPGLPWG